MFSFDIYVVFNMSIFLYSHLYSNSKFKQKYVWVHFENSRKSLQKEKYEDTKTETLKNQSVKALTIMREDMDGCPFAWVINSSSHKLYSWQL